MSKNEGEKQERIENYERLRTEMKNKGFEEKVCTISVVKANLLAFVTAIPVIGICLIIYIAQWNGIVLHLTLLNMLLFLIAMIVCIVAHEILHGLTWSLFCKGKLRSIHLGIMWDVLTPYCHCKESLRFGSYLLGGLMPLIVLGIGLFILALLLGNTMLLGISFMNILAAGGDMAIVFMLLKQRSALIFDHPTECGFIAFHKQVIAEQK